MGSRWIIECRRWFKDALEDLKVAELLYQYGHYAHTCFHCQQAREKFLKALLYARGIEARGYSIYRLLNEFSKVYNIEIEDKYFNYARELDKYYAPPRYPNLHPGTDLAAFELYTKEEAERCLRITREIFEFLKKYLPQLKNM